MTCVCECCEYTVLYSHTCVWGVRRSHLKHSRTRNNNKYYTNTFHIHRNIVWNILQAKWGVFLLRYVRGIVFHENIEIIVKKNIYLKT